MNSSSEGNRGHDDARSETTTNATMTASLTPAVMPARRLGPVAIFQWPSAWAMICLVIAVDFVWASQVELTIGGGEIIAAEIGALLALSAAFRRRNRGIANMAEAWALWFAFTPAIAVLSYLAASCASPLQDVMMERLDRAIGFDWSTWHDAVLDRPILKWLLLGAYGSVFLQTILSIIYFPATDRSRRIGELLLLACSTAAATMLISATWPTLGPCAANGPSFGACAANGGGDVITYLRDVLALRAGGPWHFELSAMEGIVTMPSYHTVMAVLLTYAFRRTGLVGYGIATLNLLMLLSIPPIGGHYLVDVLAGLALALGVIAVQRAPWHGVSRILFGPRRETLVGKASIRPAAAFLSLGEFRREHSK
jgi:membrane-associated phospholipid phosphatase